MSIPVAVLERPSDPDRILSFVTGEQNTVSKLACLAVEIDEKVRAILPPLRNLSGVAVAGLLTEPSSAQDTLLPGDVIHEVNGTLVATVAQLQARVAGMQHGDPVVLHIERQGQMQYLVLEID